MRIRNRYFKRLSVRGETLEQRVCLDAYAMVAHAVTSPESYIDSNFVDFNGDGVIDIVSTHHGDGGVAFSAGLVGGGLDKQHRLYDSGQLLAVVDFDGDQDNDLVLADNGSLFWLEHDLENERLTRYPIAASGFEVGRSDHFRAADIDQNGVIDFVFADRVARQNNMSVLFGEELADGQMRWNLSILEEGSTRYISRLFVVDLDGDGDLDLLHTSLEGLEQRVFDGVQFAPPIRPPALPDVRPLLVEDADGNGQVDLITRDLRFEFDGSRFIERQAFHLPFFDSVVTVKATDWNQDGLSDLVWELDVSAGEEAAILAVSQQQADGSYGAGRELFQVVQTHEGWGVLATATGAEIVFYSGAELRSRNTLYDRANTRYHTDVVAAELNGSRQLEVVVNGKFDNGFTFFTDSSFLEFDSESSEFKSQFLASIEGDDTGGVLVADFDGDEDSDVLLWDGGAIATSLNNGAGDFGEAIRDSFGRIRDTPFIASDLEGDGTDELLRVMPGPEGAGVYLLEFDVDSSTWNASQIVPASPSLTAEFHVADFNADGLLDLLVYDQDELRLHWQTAAGEFDGGRPVFEGADYRFHVADVNGNGKPDIAGLNTAVDNRLILLFNLGGSFSLDIGGSAGERSRIHDWISLDIDVDGDDDFVMTDDNAVFWVENIGGSSFRPREDLIATRGDATAITAADMDGDGDADLLASLAPSRSRPRIAWYEDRLIGDANGDGLFNSGDLVQVFERGHYEADSYRPVGFDDGDFNQDGRVDTRDLVFALAENGWSE